MAFTMHSHSGEFCPGHAADTLEAIILRAISLGFQTIGLTEHMPRTHANDLYPEEEWIRMGGKFTFSDDSHGVAQVGTNYLRGLDYLEGLGVTELWTFERVESTDGDEGKAPLREKAVTIAEFRVSLRLD
ncbi:hypothetical protein B0T18DRAFT_392613 [Schizothecium vesticola]|uniref:Histidinol-phosphatase n=1 Tax=Schizothecium vesticola TaxID=314040 RepID=A0AA40K2W1_9PEZI|nr:hypothetical protein B0T18DRAFT_392613 [Schizothecium vesticola]